MRKYRIKQLGNTFTVQIKTLFGWRNTNYFGKYDLIELFESSTRFFVSLKEAKEQIDKWLEKPKYHPYP